MYGRGEDAIFAGLGRVRGGCRAAAEPPEKQKARQVVGAVCLRLRHGCPSAALRAKSHGLTGIIFWRLVSVGGGGDIG
jgi:hypothetical protein